MKMNPFAGSRALLTSLLFLASCSLVQAGTLGVLTYEIIGDEVTITDCDETATGTVAVPATIEGKPVTSIGYRAFGFCRSVKSISLPASITGIDNYAFWACNSLDSIIIPDSVISIGLFAFKDCTSLTNIEIPVSVSSIDNSAFRGCSDLLSIDVVAENLYYSSINGVIFNAGKIEILVCPEGKSGAYSIPAGVTRIGETALYGCSLLTAITIPDSVTSIGRASFRKCSSLSSITLPGGITSIADAMFMYCGSLTSIALPSGITSIGVSAFSYCSLLAEIEFPSGVASIHDQAFRHCSKLNVASFLGDAPVSFGNNVFDETAGYFSIYYRVGSTDFTSPIWEGYPAVEIEGSMSPSGLWLLKHGFDYGTSLDQDMNGDGVTLLTAYALNLDPSTDLSGSLPGAEVAADAMGMTYYAASPGITYTVETSADLETWTETGVSVSGLDPQFRSTATVDLTAPHRFLRLRVEQ
ncbi:MAG: leucine-rich repeat domain-containing protein [Verrucomicrobia bacterium]|nr:leucine-rich repeat domain-containing protein [Verrucomicrobiota bacterium]